MSTTAATTANTRTNRVESVSFEASNTSTPHSVQLTRIRSSNESNIKSSTSTVIDQDSKWIRLSTNVLFWTRICTLFLTIPLLILSTAYCVAQIVEVKLDLVRICDPKSSEEIWHHSYEAALVDGEVVINAESQHGHTSDSVSITFATPNPPISRIFFVKSIHLTNAV